MKLIVKYLLKQRIRRKKEQSIIHIFPNQFSSGLIKLARKKDIVKNINQSWNGKYFTIKSYDISINDYNILISLYKKKIEQKRKQFYDQDPLIQLILILKYIFKRNNKAKDNKKYSAIQKAYQDKQEFLEIALEIAKNIKNSNFLYGWQKDLMELYHPYVYYFQIGTKQVSFHSDKLIANCPEFKGKWIGYRNKKFPFKIKN